MRLIAIAALTTALAVGGGIPAEAAKTKRVVVRQTTTRVVTARRVPPRVVVQRRSYLDAGTEVYPGSQSYTDYVFPPNYSPFGSVSPFTSGTGALPDKFWLPSYHSPTYGY